MSRHVKGFFGARRGDCAIVWHYGRCEVCKVDRPIRRFVLWLKRQHRAFRLKGGPKA